MPETTSPVDMSLEAAHLRLKGLSQAHTAMYTPRLPEHAESAYEEVGFYKEGNVALWGLQSLGNNTQAKRLERIQAATISSLPANVAVDHLLLVLKKRKQIAIGRTHDAQLKISANAAIEPEFMTLLGQVTPEDQLGLNYPLQATIGDVQERDWATGLLLAQAVSLDSDSRLATSRASVAEINNGSTMALKMHELAALLIDTHKYDPTDIVSLEIPGGEYNMARCKLSGNITLCLLDSPNSASMKIDEHLASHVKPPASIPSEMLKSKKMGYAFLFEDTDHTTLLSVWGNQPLVSRVRSLPGQLFDPILMLPGSDFLFKATLSGEYQALNDIQIAPYYERIRRAEFN